MLYIDKLNKLKGVVNMITKKCLRRKFKGYNLKDSALDFIIESLNDLVVGLSIDDIDIYCVTNGCMSVRYYGYYHVCFLYEGVHY